MSKTWKTKKLCSIRRIKEMAWIHSLSVHFHFFIARRFDFIYSELYFSLSMLTLSSKTILRKCGEWIICNSLFGRNGDVGRYSNLSNFIIYAFSSRVCVRQCGWEDRQTVVPLMFSLLSQTIHFIRQSWNRTETKQMVTKNGRLCVFMDENSGDKNI